MTSHKQGILVIGTQRSGSNLFRLMLNQLPEIVALHPPHILQTFMPLLKGYGDTTKPQIFATLLDDVCSFVEKNPASWDKIALDRKKVAARCDHPSLIQIFRAVHETAADFHDKPVWCCKSMANVSYIPEIEKDGLRPLYLHLYRDGRDVALSFKKAIVGEKHIYHLAKQWRQDQEESLNYTAQYASDRVVSVKYEELIAETERVMRDVCKKLGATYTPEVLQFHDSEEAKTIANAGDMWKNVAKPVMGDNSNKYLREMPESELKIFEAVAGDTLKRLGYPLHFPEVVGKLQFTPAQIAEFDAENNRLKQEFKKQVSEKDLEKRRGQEEVVSRIKARLQSGQSVAANG